METIKVMVHGALGRMGQEVLKAVCRDNDLKLVGAVDAIADTDCLRLEYCPDEIPISQNLSDLIDVCAPDVIIDFTAHDAIMPAARLTLERQINLVIGTSGLSDKELAELNELSISHEVGTIVAPNFSLGAVMLIHLSKIASPFFDYAEIIEMHHEQKIDSPSGTSMATAGQMVKAKGNKFNLPPSLKENIKGGRGAELGGIAIHSVRSPGYMANQEVIFGGQGQTLKIRHDQISREAFMPGVVMAVKEIVKRKGLTFGLENLLGLQVEGSTQS